MVLAACSSSPCGNTTSVARVTGTLIEEGRLHSLQGVSILITPRCFGFTGRFCSDPPTARRNHGYLYTLPPIIIVRLRHVPAMMLGVAGARDLADQVRLSGRRCSCAGRDSSRHLINARSFTRTCEREYPKMWRGAEARAANCGGAGSGPQRSCLFLTEIRYKGTLVGMVRAT